MKTVTVWSRILLKSLIVAQLTKKSLHVLLNPQVCYFTHYEPLVHLILSQLNPVTHTQFCQDPLYEYPPMSACASSTS